MYFHSLDICYSKVSWNCGEKVVDANILSNFSSFFQLIPCNGQKVITARACDFLLNAKERLEFLMNQTVEDDALQYV